MPLSSSVFSHVVHPLIEIIWLYDEEAPSEKRRRDIVRLANLLDGDDSIDEQQVIEMLAAELRHVPPRAVELIRKANTRLTRRSALALDPIIANVRNAKLASVEEMERIVGETKHLKRVLTPRWFEQLRAIVGAWDPEKPFELSTHTAFMGYFTDATCYGCQYLQTLEDAFVRLAPHGSIKQKLREIAGPSAGYISTAFEMLVLRPFAASDCIDVYEPSLPAGGRGEARVNLSGQHLYIEARAKMDEDREDGSFDPAEMGVKLFRKLQEKYAAQYAGVDSPLIVFFSLGASVLHDIEAEAVIAEVHKDKMAKTLTAVVFCEFYQPHKMWLWRNRRATHRLSPDAVKTLYEFFPIRRFRKTGLIIAD
jgi:hypothetical protein